MVDFVENYHFLICQNGKWQWKMENMAMHCIVWAFFDVQTSYVSLKAAEFNLKLNQTQPNKSKTFN